MDRDWARLGDAVRHARKSAGLKQDELADAVNVSRATIQAIERGDSFKKVTHTHRAIAAYFEWDPGSIETTLAGGEPKPAEPSPDAAPATFSGVAAIPEDLPLRIKAALGDGPLVDAAVIALPAEDGDEDPDAQMVVIVRGRRGASDEQLRRAMQRWERTESSLRRSEGSTKGAEVRPES
ncbi:hypothetical protein OEIGOIKO_05845 [Streptomyces chrestomyceticus JCM 4735]|uniref:HTH cro/C1-type domain-containing protein n=1 Tax=Streptomyces chrestomyceticus JCM 4735 TaxID=1306181 RepID=A0A7U9Q144_9ACTN|nr:helix-turn-helix transcriptional regulator [Streptomyces chrestomyceticus]GCD38035.1 hypothetical protein OEIGOIKO_05845 [Streptomyces chrestomyceticus JCM 4735]